MNMQSRRVFATIGGLGAAALVLGGAGGCVSPRAPAAGQVAPAEPGDASAFAIARQTVCEAFPSAGRTTQRAIITVRRRQFVCDGLLTVSPGEGWHLALISTLGLVTDVRVNGDGTGAVLKVTPLFREDWARDYVMRELLWVFVPPPGLAPVGRRRDGRLVLESPRRGDGVRVRYVCSANGRSWEELEVECWGRRLFYARISGYRTFPGWPRAVPGEVEADAGTHQLHLRIAAISVTAVLPGEGAR